MAGSPIAMTDLADRLGPERAETVIRAAGGSRLAIPSRLEDGGAPRALERLVGRKIAIALVLHYGGTVIYIPQADQARGEKLKLGDVVRMTRSGKSAATIARRFGCSERAVHYRREQARSRGLLPQR